MVTRPIVVELLARLHDTVEKLRVFQGRTEAQIVSDYAALWAVEHGLQIAAQCVIDICNHLVSEVSSERPADYRELILAAGSTGVLPSDFAQRLSGLAGFRNLLVHEYAKVDPAVVYQHLREGLADFDRFAEQVRRFLAKAG